MTTQIENTRTWAWTEERTFQVMFGQFLSTLIWQATDDQGESLEYKFDISDFDSDTRQYLETRARDFFAVWGDKLSKDHCRYRGSVAGLAGHNLAMSANGHGVGFFDSHWDEATNAAMQLEAENLGPFEVYVGDDTKLHVLEENTQ